MIGSRAIPGTLVVLALLATPSLAGPAAAFDVDGPVETTEGHTTLSWSSAGGGASSFRLQESEARSFEDARVRYEGPDRASFVSGLPEGSTWFRVQAVDGAGIGGPWSEPIRVDVHYPPLPRVVRLLAIGAVVFVCTVGAVFLGHRRHRAGER